MKLHLATLLFIFSTTFIFGQVKFEQGYLINNNGDKTTCFIKNFESIRTPTKFEYKLNLSDNKTITGDIQNTKEFGIPGKFKYIRQTVDFDTEAYKITTTRNPIFESKTVFTKVIIEGKASLYAYFDGESRSFFYELENDNVSSPKTLIYKEFITERNSLRKNESYKQELMNHLVCENLDQNDFLNLEFFENSLLKLFKKYNTCTASEYTVFTEKRKGKFNLKIAPRVTFIALSTGLGKNDNRLDTDFDDKTQFFIGVELEYILPFNKNKWSVFIDPTYQYFKQENVDVGYNEVMVSIDYSSIELPIGFRHYMFLNDASKIFFNMGVVVDLVINNKFEYNLIPDFNESIFSTPNFMFGLGYNFNNKFDIEYRFNTRRNLFTGNINVSDYKTSNIILRYNFL